jgi:hypothetical protein
MIVNHKDAYYFTMTDLREMGACRIAQKISTPILEPTIWLLEAMRVSYVCPTIHFRVRSNQELNVLQAGLYMGSIGTFQPKGGERSALQAQVSSKLIKNKKTPTDVKRSSSRAKADSLVKLLHYRSPEEYCQEIGDASFGDIRSLVKNSTPVKKKGMTDLIHELHYNDKFDVLARIFRGHTTTDDQKQIDSYLKGYDEYLQQVDHRNRLEDIYAVLQELPAGGPSMYRLIVAARQTSTNPKAEKYGSSIRDFPNMDSLPDVIQSKLALLKLGNGESASMVGMRLDSRCGFLERYGFIGEDLGELFDTRGQSEEGGGSLP